MDFIKQLETYLPQTESEKEAKEEILAAYKQDGSAIFSRENNPLAHMTASSIILNPEMDKTLMVYHNIYQSFSWTGGHADGDEDLLHVAVKEAQEETGVLAVRPISATLLSVDILPVMAHEKRGTPVPKHVHYNATYGLICSEKEKLTVKPDENSDVAWLQVSSLSQTCSEPEMIPVYEKTIARMRTLQAEKQAALEILPSRLPGWYQTNKRDLPWRKDKEPYHVWLSEIMLQQTRVEAVKGYYARFLAEFPTIKHLAEAEEDRLMKLWEGLGYYNRARNLQKAAKQVMADHGGKFPTTYEAVHALPGIGDYTAGAICSICHGQPEPAVDGNVLRVISRVTEDFESIDLPPMKKRMTEALRAVYQNCDCGDFTQSLMELGATVCVPNGEPNCRKCPVADICMANHNGSKSMLPVRAKKKARRIERHTVFLFQQGETLAVRKRVKKGLLPGLWEFPNVPGTLDESGAMRQAEAFGLSPSAIIKSMSRKHIFTHVEWHMTGYVIACDAQNEAFLWADETQFAEEISLPTAFRIFLD